MGTGSYGGGGSGGVRSTSGAVRSFGGRLQSDLPSRDVLEPQVRAIFRSLPREYVLAYLKSPLVQSLYKALFRLNVALRQNHSWDYVEHTYGITPERGCLQRLAGALLSQHGVVEPNEKVRQTAAVCLNEFLVRAVGNDTNLLLRGTAREVISGLSGAAFDSTSAIFLTTLLTGILSRERERIPKASEFKLKSICEGMANRIVANYAAERRERGEVRYRELLEVVANAPDVFIRGMRH